MTVEFVDAHRHDQVEGAELGVEPILAALQDTPAKIAPSTHVVATSRAPSARSVRDAQLAGQIRAVHEASYGVYGARKVHAALNRSGTRVARCTVERLMRDQGLQGIARAKTRRTTMSAGAETPRPSDLVRRQFVAAAPNRLLLHRTDYGSLTSPTSVPTRAAFVLDAFSRNVVGWQVSTTMRTALALDALDMGLWARQRARQDTSALIHHSDRGVQYRALRYTERLAEADAVASVGSKGDSYDNAMAEAFNSLFKAELIRNRGPWKGVTDLEVAVAEYVDWFNHRRLHGELDHRPPVEVENDYWPCSTIQPPRPNSRPRPDNWASTKPGAIHASRSTVPSYPSRKNSAFHTRVASGCATWMSSSKPPAVPAGTVDLPTTTSPGRRWGRRPSTVASTYCRSAACSPFLWGVAHTNEVDCRARSGRRVRAEAKSSGLQAALDDRLQARFEERSLARVQNGDLPRVNVDADEVVPKFGNRRRRTAPR